MKVDILKHKYTKEVITVDVKSINDIQLALNEYIIANRIDDTNKNDFTVYAAICIAYKNDIFGVDLGFVMNYAQQIPLNVSSVFFGDYKLI